MKYLQYDFSTFTRINTFIDKVVDNHKAALIPAACIGLILSPKIAAITLAVSAAVKGGAWAMDKVAQAKKPLIDTFKQAEAKIRSALKPRFRTVIDKSFITNDATQMNEHFFKGVLSIVSSDKDLQVDGKEAADAKITKEAVKLTLEGMTDQDITPLVHHYNKQLRERPRMRDQILDEFADSLSFTIADRGLDNTIEQTIIHRLPNDTCTQRCVKKLISM